MTQFEANDVVNVLLDERDVTINGMLFTPCVIERDESDADNQSEPQKEAVSHRGFLSAPNSSESSHAPSSESPSSSSSSSFSKKRKVELLDAVSLVDNEDEESEQLQKKKYACPFFDCIKNKSNVFSSVSVLTHLNKYHADCKVETIGIVSPPPSRLNAFHCRYPTKALPL